MLPELLLQSINNALRVTSFGPGDCFSGPKMAFLNFTKFNIFRPNLALSWGSFTPLKTIGLQEFWHQSFVNHLLSLEKIRILNLNYQILSYSQNTRAHQQICPSNQNLATSPACFPKSMPAVNRQPGFRRGNS